MVWKVHSYVTCLVEVDSHAAERRADHAQEDRGRVELGQDDPV